MIFFQLSEVLPQPKLICSKCIKKIQTISSFRTQCSESERILAEFQLHIEVKAKELEIANDQNEFSFDIDTDDTAPEQIEQKFFPYLHTDLFETDPRNENEVKQVTNVSAKETNPPSENETDSPSVNGANASQSNETNSPQSNDTNPSIKTNPPPSNEPYPPASNQIIEPPSVKRSNRNKRVRKPNNAEVNRHIGKMPKKANNACQKRHDKKKEIKSKRTDGDIELCELCGLSFTNAIEYKNHVRRHKERGKSFWSPNILLN